MSEKKIALLLLAGAVLFLSGCNTTPYDYSALQARPPKSILIMPPANKSIEVNAPYVFMSTITRPLAEKGYYVFPVSVVDHFMKENGMPTTAEMNAIPLTKIAEVFGADAVLYTTIKDWGQKYKLLASSTVVDANMKLIDVQTGTLLWNAKVYKVQSSDDGGQGLAGALVNAIATQIISSKVDQTRPLSVQAVNASVNNTYRGLLPGPFAPVETE